MVFILSNATRTSKASKDLHSEIPPTWWLIDENVIYILQQNQNKTIPYNMIPKKEMCNGCLVSVKSYKKKCEFDNLN